MSATTLDRPARIALLNDHVRRTFSCGKVMTTAGVASLPDGEKAAALQAMRAFDSFDESSDPYGEHEFGCFELNGQKFFFKFDYYDKSMEYGSDDPTDPDITIRVLTLMLAEEY